MYHQMWCLRHRFVLSNSVRLLVLLCYPSIVSWHLYWSIFYAENQCNVGTTRPINCVY